MAWLVPDRKQHDVYTPFPYGAGVDPGFWMPVRMEKLMPGYRAIRFVPTAAVGPRRMYISTCTDRHASFRGSEAVKATTTSN